MKLVNYYLRESTILIFFLPLVEKLAINFTGSPQSIIAILSHFRLVAVQYTFQSYHTQLELKVKEVSL